MASARLPAGAALSRGGAALVAAALLASCQPARGTPAPASSPRECCTQPAFSAALAMAREHRNPAITERRFTHAQFWNAVDAAVRSPALRVDSIGSSILGREIRAVTFGTGPTRVLLWSQMHGDESTATMALADVLGFLGATGPSPLRARLARQLTIKFVPMLNPDGAEQFQRHNAVGVDINRDARNLATPEARALKNIHERFSPHFGFNLHDQNARTRAGRNGPASGIALLPPAFDETQGYNDVRERARKVAALLATVFAWEIPGRVAKYDDEFNPRAFGDLVQQWGTSTVLIESGALPDDPQKQRLRELHAAALLVVLDAIATGGYESADPAAYESLPFNAGGAYDLIIRGGRLVMPRGLPMAVDIAINYDDAVARTGGTVREVGDLSGAVAIDTIDATGAFLHPGSAALTPTPTGPMLRIGAPAEFELIEVAIPEGRVIRRLRIP